MKKIHWGKITILSLAVLTCISIPVILYFTIGQHQSQETNLNNVSISYLAEINYMDNISDEEATTIRTDINNEITRAMNRLNLEENTDYQINNLDQIQNGFDLNNFDVTVTSIPDSTKATGSFRITLNVQENISQRSISTLNVPADEENGLTQNTVNNILANIQIGVQSALSTGQSIDEDIDYTIANLNLITVGAAFSSYNNQISVQAISPKLKGSFQINFQLQ